MTTKPVLGISGCLTGSAVRFDGGHKRMGFVMDEPGAVGRFPSGMP